MNKAILVGRLTADPELKTSQSGVSVCSFAVAVDRRFVRQGEQRQADFINCVAWRTTAEFICKYFTKGRMIGLAGSIQTRSWDTPEGQKRYATEVVVDEAYFTESKGASQGTAPVPNTFAANTKNNNSQSMPGNATAIDDEDFFAIDSEDDLPF